MVDGTFDQDEGFARGARPVVRGCVEGRGVGCCGAPGVLLAVDEGQARVAEVEAAVLVDRVDVGRLGVVEGFHADDRVPRYVTEARDDRELIFWDPRPGL